MNRPGSVRAGRRLLLTLAMVIMTAGGLWASALPASAHNTLRSTNPADGAQLTRTPSAVVLTFDEPAIAMGTQLVITGPDGPVQSGTPQLVDNTVTQQLNPGAPAGPYTVTWRVTSADGHPITGRFGFTSTAAGSGSSSAGGTSGASSSSGTGSAQTSAPGADPTVNAPAPISPQEGTPSWVWAGLVLVVFTVAGLGWWALRRRRGPRQD